jgi:hypothetical protein
LLHYLALDQYLVLGYYLSLTITVRLVAEWQLVSHFFQSETNRF